MSELMRGPGWWLASDGKWYPPETRGEAGDRLMFAEGSDQPEGPEWWLASDGKWYPPALRSASRPAEHHEAEEGGAERCAAAPAVADTYRADPGRDPAREESVDPSVSRRYMGFVPELGPEPPIRPELREPLFRARPADDAFGPPDAFAAKSMPGVESETEGSTGAHESTGVPGTETAGERRASARRGPRHGRRKRRWSA